MQTPAEQQAMERAHKRMRTRQTHDVLIELPHGDLEPGVTDDVLLEARISHYRDQGNMLAAGALAGMLARILARILKQYEIGYERGYADGLAAGTPIEN